VLQYIQTPISSLCRLVSPVVLRQFLLWLQAYGAGQNPIAWKGWGLAVLLGFGGFVMAILHHQLFFVGMRTGYLMRQQAIAAIHSKAREPSCPVARMAQLVSYLCWFHIPSAPSSGAATE